MAEIQSTEFGSGSLAARPKRIQRQRTKGWRMPPNAVYVGRPTKWGNPFRVGVSYHGYPPMTADIALRAFRINLHGRLQSEPSLLDALRGKDLACWCPLDQPCHADILLELANSEPTQR